LRRIALMEHEAKRYKYPLWANLSSTVPSLLSICIGLALLLLGIGMLFNMLPDIGQGYPVVVEALGLLVAGCVFLIGGATVLTLYTEVIVTTRGIKVRVFIFRWIFIPWEDILDVTVPSIPVYNDPNLWCFIRVRKLTLFHRLVSLNWRTGSDPVLIISKYMDGYRELIKIIEEHVEHNQATSGEERCQMKETG
jgi:hypothetical protein